MAPMIKLFVTKVFKNFLGMLVTEKVIVWAAKLYAEKTETLIDDHFVDLLEAGFNNDIDKAIESGERLVNELLAKKVVN